MTDQETISVEDAIALNENQQEMYKKLAGVEELLKNALTPQEERDAAKNNQPLTKAELEAYEAEKAERAKQAAKAQSSTQEELDTLEETMNSLEDKTIEWLDGMGVETGDRHGKLFDTFLHEAIAENKTLYKENTAKFWQEVGKSVRGAFKEVLKIEAEDEEMDFVPKKTSKWAKNKAVTKKEKGIGSMTMAQDGVSFSQKEKGELEGVYEKLKSHAEGRDILSREELYLLQGKLQQLKKK